MSAEGLVQCFEGCFVRVLEGLDGGGGAASPVTRESLLEVIDEAGLAAEGRFSANAVLIARRFVSAWADERLASEEWAGREGWRAHPLQSDWGEGRAAGEWFFDAVARLNPARGEDGALALLALRCLTLGFDGRMYYSPQEIADLRRALVLRFGFARPPAPFPPVAGAGGAGEARGGAGVFLRWLAPLAAAGILAGAYVLAERSLNAY